MATISELVPETADDVYYPAEDGEPMAETGIHVNAIIALRENLDDRYRDRQDIFIGTDQYWYWEKGNNKACRAPDIMVCFGVAPQEKPRASFFTWLENNVIPSFICEMSSESTWRKDLGEKFDEFERLGVQEYFLFDPEALYLRPQLQGWRLKSGTYHRIPINPDGSVTSDELGVRLMVEGMHLRLLDVTTGEIILNRLEQAQEAHREALEAQREVLEAQRKELEARRKALESQRLLEQSEHRSAEKDAEIARMKAQLEALLNAPVDPTKL